MKVHELNLNGITASVVAKIVGILQNTNRNKLSRLKDATSKLKHLTDHDRYEAMAVVDYIHSRLNNPKINHSPKG